VWNCFLRNRKNEEWYYCGATKSYLNKLDQLEPFSYERYGYHRAPIIGLSYNETQERQEPTIKGYENAFELKWDKNEVKRLLESSYLACELFYVGKSEGNRGPIEDRHYQIFNKQDFFEGSFDDLMGRLGVSSSEPSLYLIPSARKKPRGE
jgi:hypothetical protein